MKESTVRHGPLASSGPEVQSVQTAQPVQPVRRSVLVSWNQEAAFRRFALDFARWWPWRTHSIGGKRVRRIVLEPEVGGRIFEEHQDGRRFQWGQILEWDPPSRLTFTFHPARDAATAQDVEVIFTPHGTGTQVELIATKWENLGRQARLARRGYNLGWRFVLNVWAGVHTPGMRVVSVIQGAALVMELVRGGRTAAINRAGGEIAPAPRAGT